MYSIKAKIKGISPLRFNAFNIEKSTTGTSVKMTEDEKKEEVWQRAYIDSKGFYLPRLVIKRTIVNGAKRVKLGRGSASASLNAIMIFERDRFYLTNFKGRILTKKTGDYVITTDVVRIPPKTGARVVQRWVTLPEWQTEFEALIIDDTIHSNTIKESINYGGLYQGLLDGRPELGRFEMIEFEVKKK